MCQIGPTHQKCTPAAGCGQAPKVHRRPLLGQRVIDSASPARMVGTRSTGVEGNKRVTRRGANDGMVVALNDVAAPPSSPAKLPPVVSNTGLPVVLMVTGKWNPPPGIGEIEMILKSSGRMQHRISRIEVRADCAYVEVHADDVPHCTGTLKMGTLQVSPRHPRARERRLRCAPCCPMTLACSSSDLPLASCPQGPPALPAH